MIGQIGIGSAVAIYFVIWWTILFAVLPWGSRSQAEHGAIVPGTEPAAPRTPRLVVKALATSVLAALLFALFYWVRFHSGIDLAALPFMPKIVY